MKRNLSFLVLNVASLFVAVQSFAGGKAPEKASPAVVELANRVLAHLGEDPVLVAAVKAENAKSKTLDEIKRLDKEWMATPGIAPFMKEMMESDAARQLIKFAKGHDYCAEMFVTDNQGANVAMIDKTSDYWQGDEAKFVKCFNGGESRIYIADVIFDESSQVYAVQISVPVNDNGTAIGVLVITVNVDKVK